MNTNEYGQVTFSKDEILDMIYSGQSTKNCVMDEHETQKYNQFANFFSIEPMDVSKTIDDNPEMFHKNKSQTWNMPANYKNMDIEKRLTQLLVSKNLLSSDYTSRLIDELNEFQTRGMIDVLKFLCYLIDTCKTHDIVTGVGRGSSVSSLVLHLLDVHQIDPVKYNLDYKEFLR